MGEQSPLNSLRNNLQTIPSIDKTSFDFYPRQNDLSPHEPQRINLCTDKSINNGGGRFQARRIRQLVQLLDEVQNDDLPDQLLFSHGESLQNIAVRSEVLQSTHQ